MDGIWYIVLFIIVFLVFCIIPNAKRIINEHLSEVLTSIGGIGMALIDIQSDSQDIFIGRYTWENAWKILFVLFIVILAAGIFYNFKRNVKEKEVRDIVNNNKSLIKKLEIVEEEFYRLCSDNIKWIFRNFFTTGNERISIYKHQGGYFTLLGRYSPNPQFNKKSKHSYPDTEGLIAIAWSQGECDKQNAPIYSGNGEVWKQYMKAHCNISDLRLNAITMKSRSIFMKTLHDDSTSEDPDGIIVFEKLTPNGIDINSIKQTINAEKPKVLALLKNMKSLTRKLE